MTDLSQLLEKVRAAEAGSRELDAEIGAAVGVKPHVSGPIHPRTSPNGIVTWPLYTTSLDAIVALIEREMPGLVIKAAKIGDGSGHWQVQEAWVGDIEVVDDFSPMEARPGALAFTEVFLSALISKEKADG